MAIALINASRTASIGYSGMETLFQPLTVPPKRVFLSKKLLKSSINLKNDLYENNLSMISTGSIPLNLTILISCSISNLVMSFAKNKAPALFK